MCRGSRAGCHRKNAGDTPAATVKIDIMIRRLIARDTRLSSFRYYDLLVHIFVVILLISNLVGQKICVIPFIHFFGHIPRVSGAQLLFPIT